MRRPGNIFFLALLIGILSAAMVYRYLRTQQLELEKARQSAQGMVVNVVVANQTIPIGSRIIEQQVRTTAWPLESRPDGSFEKTQDVAGKIAKVTIQKNQPIDGNIITGEASGLLPLIIDEGMRAMSVKVDKVTGVSGFITPNSRVDILVSGTPDGAGEGDNLERSKIVLQNIKVLAIGTVIEQVDDKPVEVPTVTVLITTEDAERLTLATRQGPVHLALRHYRDDQDVSTKGVTVRELFGLDGSFKNGGKPVQRKPAPPARPSVEILLGDQRTRQTF
jgi:pilus assembly protein CpaB